MVTASTTPTGVHQAAQSASMSDHLVRVANLKAIQRANGWNDSELARQCRRQPQQVAAWFSNRRMIAERLARSLEEALQLPRYALDDREGHQAPTTPRAGGNTPAYAMGSDVSSMAVVQRRVREVPVVSWAEIGSMLDVDNSKIRNKAPHLETFATGSARAKFVAMPDDSMRPEFAAGDHVLFDPIEAPRAGDIVLVMTPDAELFIRQFRPRTAYVFDAVALNPNYHPLSSKDDGVAVVAVMVEHRRYRRVHA